jgi:ClpP class serine protease
VNPVELIWLFFLLSSLQPALQQRLLTYQRQQALRALEKRNKSRAISLIHRREGFALFGIPFGGYIDIDDSEAVIRVIEMTSKEMPIDLVLHTPGGLVLAAEQIAAAIAAHPALVTVYVPHYAMSGGTLIALAADAIVMSPSAVLGPVDPQLGELPAASILAAVREKSRDRLDDQTLVLADVGRKAQRQVANFVSGLLARHMTVDRAKDLGWVLAEGRWTHDFPINVELAQSLGLPVSADLPDEVRTLMSLFPQPRGRRPSVEYIPVPYERTGGSRPVRDRQPARSGRP